MYWRSTEKGCMTMESEWVEVSAEVIERKWDGH